MNKFKIFLLFNLAVVVIFIGYIYISASLDKYKTYYFPQIETYVKVYKPPFSKYGYVIFSKDSIFSFSEDIDFVRIYKSDVSSVRFIFNPLENNNIYVCESNNNIEINMSNFIINKIDRTDTTFFEQVKIAEITTQVAKQKYFEFFIEGYLRTIFYVDNNILDSPIKAEPIK